MATTTNYSWTTPDDTDLVKDGAAAIRTLGSSADTTVKNLNPGTTAGDIDYYTSSTAKARIAIGTAGQVLKVNSGATAPEWATPAAGSFTKITSTLAFSGATSVSIDNCFTSTYTNYLVVLENVGTATSSSSITLRFRSGGSDDTTANYFYGNFATIYSSGTGSDRGNGVTSALILGSVDTSAKKGSANLYFNNPQTSTTTTFSGSGSNSDAGYQISGQFGASTSFDGFKIIGTQNLTGNITVYGLEK